MFGALIVLCVCGTAVFVALGYLIGGFDNAPQPMDHPRCTLALGVSITDATQFGAFN